MITPIVHVIKRIFPRFRSDHEHEGPSRQPTGEPLPRHDGGLHRTRGGLGRHGIVERRHPGPGPQHPCQPDPARVDHRCLPAGLLGPAPACRSPRRPLRPAQGADRWPDRLRCRIRDRDGGVLCRRPHLPARRYRARRRLRDAGHVVDDHRHLPSRRTHEGGRRVGGCRRGERHFGPAVPRVSSCTGSPGALPSQSTSSSPW